jgi:hypothetical protein
MECAGDGVFCRREKGLSNRSRTGMEERAVCTGMVLLSSPGLAGSNRPSGYDLHGVPTVPTMGSSLAPRAAALAPFTIYRKFRISTRSTARAHPRVVLFVVPIHSPGRWPLIASSMPHESR